MCEADLAQLSSVFKIIESELYGASVGDCVQPSFVSTKFESASAQPSSVFKITESKLFDTVVCDCAQPSFVSTKFNSDSAQPSSVFNYTAAGDCAPPSFVSTKFEPASAQPSSGFNMSNSEPFDTAASPSYVSASSKSKSALGCEEASDLTPHTNGPTDTQYDTISDTADGECVQPSFDAATSDSVPLVLATIPQMLATVDEDSAKPSFVSTISASVPHTFATGANDSTQPSYVLINTSATSEVSDLATSSFVSTIFEPVPQALAGSSVIKTNVSTVTGIRASDSMKPVANDVCVTYATVGIETDNKSPFIPDGSEDVMSSGIAALNSNNSSSITFIPLTSSTHTNNVESHLRGDEIIKNKFNIKKSPPDDLIEFETDNTTPLTSIVHSISHTLATLNVYDTKMEASAPLPSPSTSFEINNTTSSPSSGNSVTSIINSQKTSTNNIPRIHVDVTVDDKKVNYKTADIIQKSPERVSSLLSNSIYDVVRVKNEKSKEPPLSPLVPSNVEQKLNSSTTINTSLTPSPNKKQSKKFAKTPHAVAPSVTSVPISTNSAKPNSSSMKCTCGLKYSRKTSRSKTKKENTTAQSVTCENEPLEPIHEYVNIKNDNENYVATLLSSESDMPSLVLRNTLAPFLNKDDRPASPKHSTHSPSAKRNLSTTVTSKSYSNSAPIVQQISPSPSKRSDTKSKTTLLPKNYVIDSSTFEREREMLFSPKMCHEYEATANAVASQNMREHSDTDDREDVTLSALLQ